MHFTRYTLFGLACSLFFGLQASGHLSGEKLDSLYRALSPTERFSHLVWTQVEQPLFPSKAFGQGLYLAEPLDAPYSSVLPLAVQLSRGLNPSPSLLSELPGLEALASISKPELLLQYFNYLTKVSRGLGISYLVLPFPLNQAEARVLGQLQSFDPNFFVPSSQLVFDQTRKRRAVQEVVSTNKYWVMSPKLADQLTSKLEKYLKNIEFSSAAPQIKNSLETHYQPAQPIARLDMPNQLSVALSKAVVIPAQRTPGILPLQTDTICLLTDAPYGALANMLRKYAYVITSYEAMAQSSAPLVIYDAAQLPINVLSGKQQVIYMGPMQLAGEFLNVSNAALLFAQEWEEHSFVLPQQLFGTTDATGLPYMALPTEWDFSPISSSGLLGYAPPEMTGLDQAARERIEAIIEEAIQSRSTPGCQLAIAVDGAIILEQGYGHLTYDSLIPVDRYTLYDLASVTKVTATLLAIMRLYEDGRLNLDKTLGDYLPEYQRSNKSTISIRSLLAHNAGLPPYVPFWERTLGLERLEAFHYETAEDERADRRSYSLRPGIALQDSLKSWILHSQLMTYETSPEYAYSDIGFMILHQVAERISGEPMDEFLNREFYQKMNLSRLTFNPRAKGIELFEIAPTEYDSYFRNELVWAEVHDRNAAVFGGVAGHAGLFANAHDLMIVLQTLLRDGKYGSNSFFKPETLQVFNQQYFPNNRRALGWDKMDPEVQNSSRLASPQSYGHSGFTGTMVWVDPVYDLVFVFLSNRIHPNAGNYQLIYRDIRTRIQDVVYEAMLTNWK